MFSKLAFVALGMAVLAFLASGLVAQEKGDKRESKSRESAFAQDKGSKAEESKKEVERKAKEMVEQMATAIRRYDVDAMMTLVDVPYFHTELKVVRETDPVTKAVTSTVFNENKVIKDRGQLRTHFVKVIESIKDSGVPLPTYRSTGILTYAQAKKQYQQELNATVAKQLEGVVSGEDRVVLVDEYYAGEKVYEGHFFAFVRIKNGAVKVVGTLDNAQH